MEYQEVGSFHLFYHNMNLKEHFDSKFGITILGHYQTKT